MPNESWETIWSRWCETRRQQANTFEPWGSDIRDRAIAVAQSRVRTRHVQQTSERLIAWSAATALLATVVAMVWVQPPLLKGAAPPVELSDVWRGEVLP